MTLSTSSTMQSTNVVRTESKVLSLKGKDSPGWETKSTGMVDEVAKGSSFRRMYLSGSESVICLALDKYFILAPVPAPISKTDPVHCSAVARRCGIIFGSTTEFSKSYHSAKSHLEKRNF